MAKPKSYLEQRREMKLNGPKPEKVKRAEAVEKAKFFKDALKEAPAKCMECGKSLAGSQLINPTSIVAHILSKSKVPSVANNPLNKVYLDIDCHTDFDNKGCDHTKKMKIFHLLRQRVVQMWPEIPEGERRRIPECLRPHGQ